MNPFDKEETKFFVLVNEEQQYSLWPDHLAIPDGWNKTGPHGDKQTCMAWVDETWTDMRPASLRALMAPKQSDQ